MTEIIERVGSQSTQIIEATDSQPTQIIEMGRSVINITGLGNKTTTTDYPAAIAVSALKLVRLDSNNKLVIADKDVDSTLLGLTTQSAIADAFPTVVLSGLYSDSSWGWTRGSPLYLGTNGSISALVPSSGFIVPSGHAENPTIINLNISQGVQISD